MVAAGWAGWRGAARLGVMGASILGPMALTGALSLAGILETRPPAELIWAAQFFIGLSVGAKYTGITGLELRRVVGAGLVYSAALAVLSLVVVELAILTTPADGLDLSLALLPGGQAELVVIALVAGADVAFVVAHHVLRMILVIALAPLITRYFR